jgi:hypothetical protein
MAKTKPITPTTRAPKTYLICVEPHSPAPLTEFTEAEMPEDFDDLYLRQGGHCFYCGRWRYQNDLVPVHVVRDTKGKHDA